MARCFIDSHGVNWYVFLPGFVLDAMGQRDVERARKRQERLDNEATDYDQAVELNRLCDKLGRPRVTCDAHLASLKERYGTSGKPVDN